MGGGEDDFNQNQYFQDLFPTISQPPVAIDPTLVPAQDGFVPYEPTTIQQAGNYGVGQAAALYGQGSPNKTFGDLTNQSFNAVSNIASQPFSLNAAGALNNQLGMSNPFMFGFSNGANPYAQQFSGMSQQTNPYASQYGSSANPYGDYFSGMSSQSNPYATQIGANVSNNPYASNVSNLSGQTNPFTSQIAGSFTANPYTANTNDSNPFIDGFANFGNTQNTAFNSTVDRALGNVQDRVNSQFGLGGRTGSGQHNKVTTEALGDVANQMYSDNFNQNQNRALTALGQGANLYNTDQSRNLQALGMNASNFNTDQNRNLSTLNTAGNFANQDFGNQLNASLAGSDIYQQGFNNQFNVDKTLADLYQMDYGNQLQAAGMGSDVFQQDFTNQFNTNNALSDIYQRDFSNQLNAAGMGSDVYQQDFNNRFNTTNTQANLFNTDQARKLQAAGMLPDIQNSQYQGALIQNQLGQQQDDLNFYNAGSGWNNLQNYADIVATLQGTQPAPRDKTSNTDKLIGLASVVGPFFSSKDYKEQKRPVNTLEKLNSIPVERWKYKDGIADSKEHIGPYAEDFKEAFGVGDGKTINIVDALGVIMRSLQELTLEVKELKA